MRYVTVPIKPHWMPAASSCADQKAGRRLAVGAGDADDAHLAPGCWKNSADSHASARRASLTTIHGTVTSAGGGDSATTAEAPAAMACGANTAPFAFIPTSATKTRRVRRDANRV